MPSLRLITLRTASALVLAAAAPLGACDALSGPSALEREIALGQEQIAAYSASVAAVDARAAAFAEAWQRAARHTDPVVLRQDLSAHAIPAGRALVAALEAMPTGGEALAAIHKPLVAAHASLVAALEGFVATPATDPLETTWAPVASAETALRAAEAAYRRDIELHYTRFRAVLVPPASPPAAQEGAPAPAAQPEAAE
jgi:hypothetical protein